MKCTGARENDRTAHGCFSGAPADYHVAFLIVAAAIALISITPLFFRSPLPTAAAAAPEDPTAAADRAKQPVSFFARPGVLWILFYACVPRAAPPSNRPPPRLTRPHAVRIVSY